MLPSVRERTGDFFHGNKADALFNLIIIVTTDKPAYTGRTRDKIVCSRSLHLHNAIEAYHVMRLLLKVVYLLLTCKQVRCIVSHNNYLHAILPLPIQ